MRFYQWNCRNFKPERLKLTVKELNHRIGELNHIIGKSGLSAIADSPQLPYNMAQVLARYVHTKSETLPIL